MLRRLGVLLAGGWIASCALAGHHPQKLPDGSFQASCTTPLTSCLQTFETLCEWHGYDVIAASERRSPQRPSRDTGRHHQQRGPRAVQAARGPFRRQARRGARTGAGGAPGGPMPRRAKP